MPPSTALQRPRRAATAWPATRRTLLAGAGAIAATLLAGCFGGGQRVITSRRDGYRERAARHLYSRYASRVYPGKMVPMLYAVGTVEVTLSPSGRVLGTHWLRRPTHAPEVVATIDQLIASASPFPAPGGTGTTRYVDTWLWDESGRFQLDTLT